MPIAKIQMPDGRIARFEIPEAGPDVDELLRTTNPIAQSMEAGLIGAGRTFVRAGQGAKRLAGFDVDDQVQEQNRLFQPLKDKFPIATAVGETLPTLPIGGGTMKGVMAAGAGIGLLQPEGNPIANAAIGGTVAGATKGVLDTTLGLAGARLPADKISRRAVKQNAGKTLSDRAKELGVKLSPAEEGGGFGAQIAEDATRTNAFTADVFQNRAEANLDAINGSILKRFGRKGNVITGRVLREVREEIGEKFDDVAEAISTWQPTQRANDVLESARGNLRDVTQPRTAALFSEVEELITRPEAFTRKKLSTTLNSINNRLGDASRKGDVVDAEVLEDLSETLLEGMEESMTKTARRTLREARRAWRDYKTISARNVVVDGDVQLGALRNQLLNKFNGKAFTEGQERGNPVFEVGRLFEQLERSSNFVGRNGGSQTSGRQLVQSLASLPVSGPLALGQAAPPQVQALIGQLGGRVGDAAARLAAIKATQQQGQNK